MVVCHITPICNSRKLKKIDLLVILELATNSGFHKKAHVLASEIRQIHFFKQKAPNFNYSTFEETRYNEFFGGRGNAYYFRRKIGNGITCYLEQFSPFKVVQLNGDISHNASLQQREI